MIELTQNTAIKTERLLTVKEAVEILMKSERWVRKLCKSGKIDCIVVNANGGDQYRISESSLSNYLAKNANSTHSLTPMSEQVAPYLELPAPTPVRAFSFKSDKSVVPEKAKKIGLLRFDTVKVWEDFRSKSKKKANADKDFVKGFNTGKLYPELFKTLGTISLGTLYRWKKAIFETNDYKALIPEYNYYSSEEKQTKLTEIEKKYFLDLLLNPSEISVGNATRLVKYVLKKQGQMSSAADITFRRFADWFKSKNYDTWTLMRKGQKALVDKVAPYIERDASLLEVGDVLVADGHVLDFQVINPFNGKPCRATLVGYVDWKSWNLVGYEIMLTENTQCISSALRNSIINLGKIPKICYQDNGQAFRSKFFSGSESLEECGFYGLFGKLGIVPVFAQPYNAKAKIIERYFREFSETCERLLPSYIGSSIMNKPAYMMRNEKFHKQIHNNFVPTIEQAVQLIESWLEFHRSQPCPNVPDKTIGEVFNEGIGQGVDIDQLDDLMMAQEIRKVGRNGVKFLNSNYWSEELYGIKEKVVIKYNLLDLSYVKVYGSDGAYVCKADTVLAVHPMAGMLGDAKDVYSLKQAIKTTKKMQKATVNKAKQLLPRLNKELLDWQQESIDVETLKQVQGDTKSKKRKVVEKQYPDIKCDVSSIVINTENENDADPIFLFDWQIEELKQKKIQR